MLFDLRSSCNVCIEAADIRWTGVSQCVVGQEVCGWIDQDADYIRQGCHMDLLWLLSHEINNMPACSVRRYVVGHTHLSGIDIHF